MASFLVKDKDFYGQMLKIAVPIAFQNMLTFAVSMMDTVMLGSLGEVAISASSLANQLTFILSVIMFGVSGGSNVLISQYWGYPQGAGYHVPGGFGAGYSILHCGIVYARRLFKDIYHRPAGY